MPSLQLTLVPDAAASSPELANVHKALQSLDVEQISLRVNSLSEQELLDLARGEIDKAMWGGGVLEVGRCLYMHVYIYIYV